MTLSLLCDHCLILHPEQLARATAKQPLCTLGSLQRRLQITSFTTWLSQWLDGEGRLDKLTQLTEAILLLVPLQESKKHLSDRSVGRLEATATLKYRAQKALAAA